MSLIPRHTWFDLDKAFDHFFEPMPMHNVSNGLLIPRVDIKEKDSSFEISAELPGVKKDDIHVHLDKGVLTIEASTAEEKTEEKEGRVIRKERYSGRMMRSFTLGSNVQESDIKANFENGILTLSIPKQEPGKRTARKIAIS